MKLVLFFFLQSLILTVAYGATYQTTVFDIDEGRAGESHLIKFSDGHVGFVGSTTVTTMEELRSSLESQEKIEVVLDKNLNIISFQTIGPATDDNMSTEIPPEEMMTYNPSVVSSSTASRVFGSMRRDYQKESQCYNRAHIWTYEEFRRSSLRTNKLFLFFTSRYIRRYRYHWWFHVTPMIYVGGTGKESWFTLDRRYTSGPLSTRTWTNVFMYNDAYCPVVYKYSSYRNNQQVQDCYLIPTSMYFWQPRDIEQQERTGYYKKQYFSSEISHAYWEAF